MPIRDMLVERLGIPVTVDNDATCATEAEWRHGVATGVSDALLITLGTGIGGGVVERRSSCSGVRTGSCPSPGTWSSTRTGRRVCAGAAAAGSATPRAAGWPGSRVMPRSAVEPRPSSTPLVAIPSP